MTVLEVLAERPLKSPAALEFVHDTVTSLHSMTTVLPEDEICSLKGALARLRERSIGQSVKALAEGLDPEAIDGHAGGKIGHFFKRCYTIRSLLVHDGVAPQGEDISQLAGSLRILLRHLLVHRIDTPASIIDRDWSSEV